MSADAMDALREALALHHSQQDPADSMAYAAHAISTLLAERRALKAEIASLNDELATARADGAEAMREAAIDVIAARPTDVGYTGDTKLSVESMLVDRDADTIAAIRRLVA